MAKRAERGTPAQYAVHRGVSRQAVTKALKAGRIKLDRGKIDFAAADQAWRANTDPTKPSNSVTGNPGGGARRKSEGPEAGTLADAVAVRAVWKARRERLAYEREAGLMVLREDVKLAWFGRLRRFYERLLVIPDRVAKSTAISSDVRENRRIVREEIVRAIEELGDQGDAGLDAGRHPARRGPARRAAARS